MTNQRSSTQSMVYSYTSAERVRGSRIALRQDGDSVREGVAGLLRHSVSCRDTWAQTTVERPASGSFCVKEKRTTPLPLHASNNAGCPSTSTKSRSKAPPSYRRIRSPRKARVAASELRVQSVLDALAKPNRVD